MLATLDFITLAFFLPQLFIFVANILMLSIMKLC